MASETNLGSGVNNNINNRSGDRSETRENHPPIFSAAEALSAIGAIEKIINSPAYKGAESESLPAVSPLLQPSRSGDDTQFPSASSSALPPPMPMLDISNRKGSGTVYSLFSGKPTLPEKQSEKPSAPSSRRTDSGDYSTFPGFPKGDELPDSPKLVRTSGKDYATPSWAKKSAADFESKDKT